ncbi:hypothetical protein BDW74DRAFT_175500 [Aspergillus multicolor]|uniref:uncharacterized protein n=1 Tax=Aspergillus multicolor TaxID=41759 RepID=UPI003CCD4527
MEYSSNLRPPIKYSNDPREYGKLLFVSSILFQVLTKCKPQTLDGVSWKLGTCVPRELLGPSGILARTQKRLKTIYLKTARHARHEVISLSAFKHLTSLSWLKVTTADMTQVCLALRQNSLHLVSFELTGVERSQEAATKLAELENKVTFPALKDLSLGMWFPTEQVHKLSSVFPLSSLRSLQLRYCDSWQDLLLWISNRRIVIGLKRFIISSIQPSDLARKAYRENSGTSLITQSAATLHALSVFIAAFSGLEELRIRCSFRLGNCLPLWHSTLGHCETLRRLLFTEEDHFITRDEVEAFGQMAGPPEGLLSELAVEFLEICCTDFDSLKRLLSRGRIRNQIRILHHRTNRSDDVKKADTASSSRDDLYPNSWPSLILFLSWAFDSDGPPLLEGIGYQNEGYCGYDSLTLLRKGKPSASS